VLPLAVEGAAMAEAGLGPQPAALAVQGREEGEGARGKLGWVWAIHSLPVTVVCWLFTHSAAIISLHAPLGQDTGQSYAKLVTPSDLRTPTYLWTCVVSCCGSGAATYCVDGPERLSRCSHSNYALRGVC
jgi:hypothetical protein